MAIKNKKSNRVYLDNAASTPVDKEVLKRMNQVYKYCPGNASAIHREGRRARKLIEESRDSVASIIGAHSDEIIFNSGGTEADNTVIHGVISQLQKKGVSLNDMHIITTPFEHLSVNLWIKEFQQKGVLVDYLEVDERGIIDPKELKRLLYPETVLVSIMYVNNEIGTVQPVRECSKIIKDFKKNKMRQKDLPYFHTDASQAPLYKKVNKELGADMITMDGQKIYGPKGIGVLYKARKVEIDPLVKGSSQENGLRGGTGPTALIAGMSHALELAERRRPKDSSRMSYLQNFFIKELEKQIPMAELNGDRSQRILNNVNISIPGYESEFLVMSLDERGISCSPGAACLNDPNEEGRNSVAALGKPRSHINSTLRFSMGRDIRKRDLRYTAGALREVLGSSV